MESFSLVAYLGLGKPVQDETWVTGSRLEKNRGILIYKYAIPTCNSTSFIRARHVN